MSDDFLPMLHKLDASRPGLNDTPNDVYAWYSSYRWEIKKAITYAILRKQSQLRESENKVKPSPSHYLRIAKILYENRASNQLIVDLMNELVNENPFLNLSTFYRAATQLQTTENTNER